jgi:hypothetical protein
MMLQQMFGTNGADNNVPLLSLSLRLGDKNGAITTICFSRKLSGLTVSSPDCPRLNTSRVMLA